MTNDPDSLRPTGGIDAARLTLPLSRRQHLLLEADWLLAAAYLIGDSEQQVSRAGGFRFSPFVDAPGVLPAGRDDPKASFPLALNRRRHRRLAWFDVLGQVAGACQSLAGH